MHQLQCLGAGQLIMLLNVITGILSRYLANDDVSLPTLQTAFVYATLAVVYLPLKFGPLRRRRLEMPLWFYALLAVIDIEGNYFAVKAFHFANYVTIGLLLNLTVPFATALCYVFLGTRYAWQHVIGALIALTGSIVVFAADYDAHNNGALSRELRGDIYCVIAAAFYATSNVMIQSVVKVRDMDANIELLGLLGLFGTVFSAIQISALEMGPIRNATFASRDYAYMVGYDLALFTFYTTASVFLRWAESLFFNLSLLTGPVCTVLASYLLFDEPVKPWYWCALGLFYVGLVLYVLSPPPIERHDATAHDDDKEFEEVVTPTRVV